LDLRGPTSKGREEGEGTGRVRGKGGWGEGGRRWERGSVPPHFLRRVAAPDLLVILTAVYKWEIPTSLYWLVGLMFPLNFFRVLDTPT